MKNYPNLGKEPQSWRLFVLSLPYARTTPSGPKDFLLLRAVVSSSSTVVRASAPFIVPQLPTTSSNTVLQPSQSASDDTDSSSWSAEWRGQSRAQLHVHWIYTHTSSIGQATKRPLHFDSPTRTRGNSDLCVDDDYCLRLLSVDTSPLTYFSPFPSRTLPWITRTMTESANFDRRSHCSGPCRCFTFVKHVSFEHSMGSSMITSRRHGNINKHAKLKIFSHSIVHRSVHFALPVFGGPRPVWSIGSGSAATSLATESTGTVLTPRQMSKIAGHVFLIRYSLDQVISPCPALLAAGYNSGHITVKTLSLPAQVNFLAWYVVHTCCSTHKGGRPLFSSMFGYKKGIGEVEKSQNEDIRRVITVWTGNYAAFKWKRHRRYVDASV